MKLDHQIVISEFEPKREAAVSVDSVVHSRKRRLSLVRVLARATLLTLGCFVLVQSAVYSLSANATGWWGGGAGIAPYPVYYPLNPYSAPIVATSPSYPIFARAFAPFYGFNAYGFSGNSLYQTGILPSQNPYATGQLQLQAQYIDSLGGDPTMLYRSTQWNWAGTQPLGLSYLPPVGPSAISNYWDHRSYAGSAR
jgi:hypothetical protein